MDNDYNKINDYILQKCSELPILKSEIQKNGIIVLKKTKLDLFSFLTKTIISQQISDKVAEITWKKYCFKIREHNHTINKIPNKIFLKKILDVVGLSKKKKITSLVFINHSIRMRLIKKF